MIRDRPPTSGSRARRPSAHIVDGRRVITSSSPPPGTACTPSTTASSFSPSPNLFSGKANPPMTDELPGQQRPTFTEPICFRGGLQERRRAVDQFSGRRPPPRAT